MHTMTVTIQIFFIFGCFFVFFFSLLHGTWKRNFMKNVKKLRVLINELYIITSELHISQFSHHPLTEKTSTFINCHKRLLATFTTFSICNNFVFRCSPLLNIFRSLACLSMFIKHLNFKMQNICNFIGWNNMHKLPQSKYRWNVKRKKARWDI